MTTKMFNIREASILLDLTPERIRQWIHRSQLNTTKLGGVHYIAAEDLSVALWEFCGSAAGLEFDRENLEITHEN
jgi:hypothetical protein